MYAQLENKFWKFDYRILSASIWLDVDDQPRNKEASQSLFEKVGEFFTVKRLLRNLRDSNESVKNDITRIATINVNYDQKQKYSVIHKNLISLLDKIYFVQSLDTSMLSNNNTIELAKEIKTAVELLMKYELEIRLKFFPERNLVALTYVEMKELRDCMKDWDPAEEQSDIYIS